MDFYFTSWCELSPAVSSTFFVALFTFSEGPSIARVLAFSFNINSQRAGTREGWAGPICHRPKSQRKSRSPRRPWPRNRCGRKSPSFLPTRPTQEGDGRQLHLDIEPEKPGLASSWLQHEIRWPWSTVILTGRNEEFEVMLD